MLTTLRPVTAPAVLAIVFLAVASGVQGNAPEDAGWLDRPLNNWNRAGASLPRAAAGPASRGRANESSSEGE